MFQEIPQDNVIVDITVEEAIVSDTVKVSVNVALSITSDNAIDVRHTITSALKNVLDTDWAFTKLDRTSSRSGLEEVSATATARIPENQAAGMSEKAKLASRQGLQLTMGPLDYNPARNVIDSKLTELRKSIYAKAQLEAKVLNEMMGEGSNHIWRVGGIQFGSPDSFSNARVANNASYTMAASAAPGGGGGAAMDLTQKVSLTASVSLMRVVLGDKA